MTPDKMESIGVRFLIVHQMIFILKFFCTIQQMNVFLYGYSIELNKRDEQCANINSWRWNRFTRSDCWKTNEAYELLYVENYDLVILDLNLPGMDGLEVLDKIREKNQKLKVLILSARDSVSDKVKGLDLGANDYLTKPLILKNWY